MTTMWGIHNDALGSELVDDGFISIGWAKMGPITAVGTTRSSLKTAVERTYPNAKPGAVAVWAGTLYRFAFTMVPGDLVIYPNKADRTLNFGVVEGEYEFDQDVPTHPHRRTVRWVKTGVARSLFPQPALYEIGSAITLFQVRRHASIFKSYFSAASDDVFEEQVAKNTTEPETAATWAADEPDADRIEEATRDFVLKALLTTMSHEEFEHFTADLLRALGYQARVTRYSADGGVDVIAHKDALGLEPPIIKVQCKHTTATQSRPDVQRLIGTLASDEVGLFVTLGIYSRDASDLERERQNLRLLSGKDVVDLTIRYREGLSGEWRSRLPLRPIYVVDRSAAGY